MTREACTHTCNPGHPMYGARCKLAEGHDGEHDCGTETEAYNAFYGRFAELRFASDDADMASYRAWRKTQERSPPSL